jgi:hypothetical protein
MRETEGWLSGPKRGIANPLSLNKARTGSNPVPSAAYGILDEWMSNQKRNPNTSCVVCSKSIYKRPSVIQENNGRVFCSLACYGVSNRKEVPCVMCGAPILSGLNKKTCSRACANKLRTGIQYKQGRPRDKVKSYQALKIRLLKLRGNVCERCGYKKLEILQVHHKDKNHTNNDIDNLELICPNCHFEEHYLEKSWLNKSLN